MSNGLLMFTLRTNALGVLDFQPIQATNTITSRCLVAQFPKKDQTRADHFTVVLSPEARDAISLNGETLPGHQQPIVTNIKDRLVQREMVEQPRSESADSVIRKVERR